MKTYIIALIAFFIIQTNSTAQTLQIGIKGGVTLSQLKTGEFFTTPFKDGQPWSYNGTVLKENLQNSYDTRTGYVFGAYAKIGAKKLYFNPEIYVATKGGSIDLVKIDPIGLASGNTTPSIYETVKISYTNIDVPLLVGYKFLKIFNIHAGPVASLNVGSNQKLGEALKFYANNNINDTFEKATLSYQIGAGVQFLSLGLDIRHENSFKEVTSIPLGNTNFAPKAKGWLVTLSYKIL